MLHRLRLSVPFMRLLVFEREQVSELRWVALCLPGRERPLKAVDSSLVGENPLRNITLIG
jgi:hypothetical protein